MGLINVFLITQHVDNDCISAPFLIQSVFSNQSPSQLMCFWLDVSSALTKNLVFRLDGRGDRLSLCSTAQCFF